jgi:hypothetical protein
MPTGRGLAGLRLFPLAALLFAAACGSHDREEWRKWYIPLEASGRAQKDASQVAFLESEPKDRKFKVVGIIAPPDDKFDSFGETVNAVRGAAGLYGADAIFLISEEEGEKWGFHAGGGTAGGGKQTTRKVRAKAIVWIQ